MFSCSSEGLLSLTSSWTLFFSFFSSSPTLLITVSNLLLESWRTVTRFFTCRNRLRTATKRKRAEPIVPIMSTMSRGTCATHPVRSALAFWKNLQGSHFDAVLKLGWKEPLEHSLHSAESARYAPGGHLHPLLVLINVGRHEHCTADALLCIFSSREHFPLHVGDLSSIVLPNVFAGHGFLIPLRQ